MGQEAFSERTAKEKWREHMRENPYKRLPDVYKRQVFAPYHVNHNFIRPSIFGLYLIQRASGFFLKQFKTAIRCV